jgi:hypothetical protein
LQADIDEAESLDHDPDPLLISISGQKKSLRRGEALFGY